MAPAAGLVPIPFIVGSGRSGTTLLRLMLDSHPDLAIPPETQFIPQVARACESAAGADRPETFLKAIATAPRWPDFLVDESALRRRVQALQPFEVSQAFRAFYSLYAERFGKRRWGDQTPLYAFSVDLIRELFPEAHFVQLIRDGRDVVLSYREVWFGPPTLEATIRRWLDRVEAAQQARWFEHYLEIRYEDLIQSPEATLRQVCAFLDLSWHPAVLDYHARASERMSELHREYPAHDGRVRIAPDERLATHRLVSQPPDLSRVGRWRRKLPYADLLQVEDLAGDKLRALGYDLVTRGTLRARLYRPVLFFRRWGERARRSAGELARALRGSPSAWLEPIRKLRQAVIGYAHRAVRPRLSAAPGGLRLVRFSQNPILRPGLSPRLGNNLNGPSLIAAPAWLPDPLGRYYLYFAHHRGTFIRLAYADRLEGPWAIYEPGTLQLSDTHGLDHLASPDVHVDDERRLIRMYFHCPVPGQTGQVSFVATSDDGIRFTARPASLGQPYFRVFRWDGYHYALARTGALYRSRDGLSGFESGPNPFPVGRAALTVRHVAVQLEGHKLRVFYSLIGDAPERILLSTIDLQPDWTRWRASRPGVVLEPEMEYEGVHLPLEPSQTGLARNRVRQLRDPAIFVEGDQTYLLYSVAGENGIAIGELRREGN